MHLAKAGWAGNGMVSLEGNDKSELKFPGKESVGQDAKNRLQTEGDESPRAARISEWQQKKA